MFLLTYDLRYGSSDDYRRVEASLTESENVFQAVKIAQNVWLVEVQGLDDLMSQTEHARRLYEIAFESVTPHRYAITWISGFENKGWAISTGSASFDESLAQVLNNQAEAEMERRMVAVGQLMEAMKKDETE